VTLTYHRRIMLLALLAGAPAVVVSILLLAYGSFNWPMRGALIALVAGLWIGLVLVLRNLIDRPLRTVSNVVAALREDDFSIRAREASADDALGQLMIEVNALAETLRLQRLGAQEAAALLRAVMAEIDVAIFAFDAHRRLVLVNRFGEKLLARSAARLLNQPADELGLHQALAPASSVADLSFPGGSGRFEVRRTKFWQGGTPHELLVLSDISQPLREQEREAWKRLIRVISHELNNSLAPIKSIAGSLESLLGRTPAPPDLRDDLQHGLAVIASRAEALSRFTASYARLARLPPPVRTRVDFAVVIGRVVALEQRLAVQLVEGPSVEINADADQLEQLLINLIRNAVDAALETGGCVRAGWGREDHALEVWIEDEGPGLSNTANLFVPFFTTKTGGSGVGLALCRQIADGHGGSLIVENRADRRGARAVLRLPP
jgi:two-component system, NtrC family, nitrogen regulation sensor histidine kinase NtrY